MTQSRDVQIFLESGLLHSARAGQHNFIKLMQNVLEDSGLSVCFRAEGSVPDDPDALSLVHMKPPLGRNGLTFRRVYHYPFWQIETTERRWDWTTAQTVFAPDPDQSRAARKFQRFWRKRLYDIDDAPPNPDGIVYVPLQGRLTEARSFQSMSPIAMLRSVLDHDPYREIVATLHPKERYSQQDRDALNTLCDQNPRLTLGSKPPGAYLPACAYVVAQNSSVAFDGFLFDRPAILFAKIDFHHIAPSVLRTSVAECFAHVMTDRPNFAAYVHWFWQHQSINAGRPEAAEKIKQRFLRLGWPL